MNLLQRTVTLPLRLNPLRESCIFRLSEPLMKNITRSFNFEKGSTFTAGPKMEARLKRKDKMTSRVNLIYNNPFSYWIETGYHLQRVVVIIGSSVLIYFIKQYLDNTIKIPYILDDKVIIRSEKEFVAAMTATFTILILTTFLCKWSVLRIYFDCAENVNKAVLVGNLPFTKKIITIKPESVSPVIRRFPIEKYRTFEYQIDGNKMLLYEDYFKTPADLYRMLKCIH